MAKPVPVTVFGLQMTDELQARIVTAVRGLYPELTTDKSDPAALQAVLAWLAEYWMTTWETRNVPDPNEAAEEARQKAIAEQQAAAEAAAIAASGIVPTVMT